MDVHSLTVGPFQSNCFIAACPDTKEAIIIDACDEPQRILDIVRANDLDVKLVFNTHAHIDHVSGLAGVVSELNVPVWMHHAEMHAYESLPQQAAMFGLPAPQLVDIDKFVEDGDEVKFGNLTGRVIDTPGHSPGGVTLLFEDTDPKVAFVGDVLFNGSIGRTDLPGSDHRQMINTLQNVIMALPDDALSYSGHGPETTIAHEKQTNPFLLQLQG